MSWEELGKPEELQATKGLSDGRMFIGNLPKMKYLFDSIGWNISHYSILYYSYTIYVFISKYLLSGNLT